MIRARLEEEVEELNRLYDMVEDELPEFFEFFDIEYTQELMDGLDDGDNSILQDIISNIEQNLTLEEKNYFYEHIDIRLYPYLQDTERKIQKLQSDPYINDDTKSEIIKSLETDEQKLPFIDELCASDDVSYPVVTAVASLSDDNIKMQYMETLVQKNDNQYDYNIIRIVKSMQDDSLKMGVLEKVDDFLQAEIVSTFKDDEKKIELLDDLKDLGKSIVICSLQSDELKIEQLKTFEGTQRYEIVRSLSSDKLKLTFLPEFNDEEKREIIKTFKTDEDKIKALEMQKIEYSRAIIIGTLKDDVKKVELLEGIKQRQSRDEIITHIRSEAGRKLFLEIAQDNEEKQFIFKQFTRDEMISFFSEKDTQQKYPEVYGVYRKIYENAEPSKKPEVKYTSFGLPQEMTIGAEIEAEGENSEIIRHAKTLRDNKAKNDGSLTDGVEVITGIMHDTQEDVANIYEVANLMQDLGLTTSENCGGHIHIGADYIETNEQWQELLELWVNAEEVLCLISNKPGELPRDGVYIEPIGSKFKESNITSKKDNDLFIEDAKKIQDTRRTTLNLLNVHHGKNTIEFRLSNGTLDPNVWIENIRLYGRIVQKAKELGIIKAKQKNKEKITPEEQSQLQHLGILKSQASSEQKMEALMQILFDEEERKVYDERFQANNELEGKQKRIEDLRNLFGELDFEQVYNETEIKTDIIQNLMSQEEPIVSQKEEEGR